MSFGEFAGGLALFGLTCGAVAMAVVLQRDRLSAQRDQANRAAIAGAGFRAVATTPHLAVYVQTAGGAV